MKAPLGSTSGMPRPAGRAARPRRAASAPGYVAASDLPGRAAGYYGDAYADINVALREGRPPPSAATRAIAGDMTAAMKPLAEDMTPWRGLDRAGDWTVGREVVERGFVSASASWRTAQRFSGEDGALVKIRARKGAPAVVENELEQEVTFRPLQRFRVVEIVDGARDGAHAGYAGPGRVYIMEAVEDGD